MLSRSPQAIFCALLALALVATAADAQQRNRRASTPGGIAEGRLMKKKAEELGLSEETIAKIDAVIDANRKKDEEIREENQAAIEALNAVLAKSLPSEKELLAAADKVGKTAARSRELKMKSVIEVRSLLTKEQLEKFMEFRDTAANRR